MSENDTSRDALHGHLDGIWRAYYHAAVKRAVAAEAQRDRVLNELDRRLRGATASRDSARAAHLALTDAVQQVVTALDEDPHRQVVDVLQEILDQHGATDG